MAEPIKPKPPEEEKSQAEMTEELAHEPQIFSDDGEANIKAIQDLYKTIKEGVRPPITGSEQLLANELAIAILSPPLEKVRHICEGIMLLEASELDLVKLSADIDNVKRIHLLSVAFSELWETFDFDELYNERQMVKIAFSFTEMDAIKYLYPWIEPVEFEGYISNDRLAQQRIAELEIEFSKKLKEIERKLQKKQGIDKELKEEFASLHARLLYWSIRDGLTVESFRSVKTAFISWAMPQATMWLKKSMNLINPEAFKDAVFALKGATPPQKAGAFKKAT